jgi:hypothetical protein
MANKYTDLAAGQLAAESDFSEAPSLRVFGGDVRYVDVKIAVTALTTSDVIYLAKLPKGARVIPALCSVDHGDPGDALTGKIGDESDDDRYGAALALGGAAGRKAFSEAGTKGDAFLNPYKFPEELWVTFTPTTVTNLATHDQVWHVGYTLG